MIDVATVKATAAGLTMITRVIFDRESETWSASVFFVGGAMVADCQFSLGYSEMELIKFVERLACLLRDQQPRGKQRVFVEVYTSTWEEGKTVKRAKTLGQVLVVPEYWIMDNLGRFEEVGWATLSE